MKCYDYLCGQPFEYCVEQGGSAEYHAFLKKPDGTPVLKSELDSITLRITNQNTGAIINDREDVNVLDDNGGSFDDESGEFVMIFGPGDHPITGDGADKRQEVHVATLTAIWGGGSNSKRWLVLATVDNLDKIAGITAT